MKRIISVMWLALFGLATTVQAQTISGTCGKDVEWKFDGNTLIIGTKEGKFKGSMDNYVVGKKNVSPWIKQNIGNAITTVIVRKGLTSIGSCAFAGCRNLREVVFEGNDVKSIGWGAFMDCSSLNTITLPSLLSEIGEVAFARCSSLSNIKIPRGCNVKEQAFASCEGLKTIDCQNCKLGNLVFVREKYVNGVKVHTPYEGKIINLPQEVIDDTTTCLAKGLALSTVPKTIHKEIDFESPTSIVDSIIPAKTTDRSNTHALIIGNQRYRFGDDVPYALHDAYVFKQYCIKALGVDEKNITFLEDATKEMIEVELENLAAVQQPDKKKLIIYYAGHGAPVAEGTEFVPYLKPTDVQKVERGIPLKEFYQQLVNMNFQQTSVFLDACFSQISGTRGIVPVNYTPLDNGRVVVFSATGKDESAHPYRKKKHGLFTYYLLQRIQGNPDISFGELYDYVKDNVHATSKKENSAEQTPTITHSDEIADEWRNLGF